MQTTQEKFICWLRAAVVFSVSGTALAAATPESNATSAAAPSDLTADLFWYQQPAGKWEEALPVGNGRLGTMVFGGTAEERLQLNESTLSGGLTHDYSNPGAGQHLSELRRLVFAGNIPEAEKLGDKMLGNPGVQRPYQPLDDLLSALPQAWSTSKVSGLHARSGFEVDCTWRDGRLTEVMIRSRRGGACRVCCRDKMIILDTKAGQSYRLNGELKS